MSPALTAPDVPINAELMARYEKEIKAAQEVMLPEEDGDEF